jgi:hypothetical protein
MFFIWFELNCFNTLCLDTLMLTSLLPVGWFKNLDADEILVELHYSGDVIELIKKDLRIHEFYDEFDNLWLSVVCNISNVFNVYAILSYLALLEYLFEDPNRFPFYPAITIYSSLPLGP